MSNEIIDQDEFLRLLPDEPFVPVDILDTEQVIPALLVEEATEQSAAAIVDALWEILGDDEIPEPMAREVRARLRDLYQRFPDALD